MRPRRNLKRVTTRAKKDTTASKTKKEKAMVKTRLMQISLRLDDHIYNNNLISGQNAALYIQEIAALKEQCHQDIPSLQVIEKLTRIMRAIKEGTAHIEDTHSNPVTPASSLPDIDTIATEDLISEYQGINSQNNSEPDTPFTLESININYDSVEIVTATGSDVTEFSEITYNVNVAGITRAISTLSVHDESSLNLLNNYSCDGAMNNCGQGIEEYNRASKTITPVADEVTQIPFSNNTRPAFLENNASKNSDTNNGLCRNYLVSRPEPCNANSQNKKIKYSYDVNDIKRPAFKVLEKVTVVEDKSTLSVYGTEDFATKTTGIYNDNSLNLQNNYNGQSNPTNFDSCGQGFDRALNNTKNIIVKQIAKAKSQTKRELTRIKSNVPMQANNCHELSSKLETSTKIQNKNANSKKQTPTQKPTKRRAKTPTAQKKKITNYFHKENQPEPDQPNEIPQKKKPTTFVPPMKENMTVIDNNKENVELLPTQPSKVDNDLSWVENLKYVRQINADEFSSMNGVKESFWKNCEFPENFDENVFSFS